MKHHNIQMDHPSFLGITVLEDSECSSGNLSPCFLILLGFQDQPGFEGFDVNRCDFCAGGLLFFLTGNQENRSQKDKNNRYNGEITFIFSHNVSFISKKVTRDKKERNKKIRKKHLTYC